MDKLKAKWKTKENKELTFTPNITKKEDGSFGADGSSYGFHLNKSNSRMGSRHSSNNSSQRAWKNSTNLSNSSKRKISSTSRPPPTVAKIIKEKKLIPDDVTKEHLPKQDERRVSPDKVNTFFMRNKQWELKKEMKLQKTRNQMQEQEQEE